jgi:mRNA interferase RelE/StbE
MSIKYTLYITPAAYRQLKKLESDVQMMIRQKLDGMCDDPRSNAFDVKKLHGREGYRLRVGDYRVIYLLNNNQLIVKVIAVGHRREIY